MENEPRFQPAGRLNWRRVWAGFLLMWTIFAALGTWFNYGLLAARGNPISWGQSIRMNVVWYGIWAMLLKPAVVLVCSRVPPAKTRWPK
jgi:hypothetical protein